MHPSSLHIACMDLGLMGTHVFMIACVCVHAPDTGFLQAEREMICKTLADGRVVWRNEKEVTRGHILAGPSPSPGPVP